MNLILCHTPLQVLIAEKIIGLYPNETFFGVMFCAVKNKKFDYYTERLAQKCEQCYNLVQKTDRFGLLKQIIQLKIKFSGRTFDKTFLASMNDLQTQFILSAIHFHQLYTFDDGTANIVKSSIYYQPEPNTTIRKCINKLLNNKFSIEKIKGLSQKHYTIYPNISNVIEKCEVIALNNKKQAVTKNENVVNILLGQPVYLEHTKNIDLANCVIKRFNIDYYLPHPREQYKLENVNYIDTPFIFEDYINQQPCDKKYRIYTYFSSAVLNVMNYPNIEIRALRIETDTPDFIECYDLLAKMGINIIDIRLPS